MRPASPSVDARAHQGAATTHRLRIDVGVRFGHAGAHQRADQAARRRTGSGADGRRRQPARGDDRTEAGNGQQAEAGQQAGTAADHTADAGTGRGRRDFIHVGVLVADVLVGHEADLAGGNAGRFDGGDRIAGLRRRYRKRD